MRMPLLFVGHGSPMNAIENNRFTEEWEKIGQSVKPEAILMLSAHWFTQGSFIQDSQHPRIINDMYGFPRDLYHVGYHVKGHQQLTDDVISLISSTVLINNDWGIDHGAWSVLNHMYPKKDIPVVQLSIDANKNNEEKFHIG
ncbi:MAG: dioxygenase, partial [Clostridia bacterium]|nr:dioxygenase [Clostridia bacterium]